MSSKLVMVSIVRQGRRETRFVRAPVAADGKVRVDVSTLFNVQPSDGVVGFCR